LLRCGEFIVCEEEFHCFVSKSHHSPFEALWIRKWVCQVLSLLSLTSIYDISFVCCRVSTKNRCQVFFDDTLEVPKCDRTLVQYRLHAVVFHKGNDISHGHYIAASFCGNKWYTCDDNQVTEIDKVIHHRQHHLQSSYCHFLKYFFLFSRKVCLIRWMFTYWFMPKSARSYHHPRKKMNCFRLPVTLTAKTSPN
jgi:hypothetical protein